MKQRFKREKAIQSPHQFTVKLSPARRTELKVMAAHKGITMLGMFEAALTEFIKSPPARIPRSPAPAGWQRIVFKVEPAVKTSVHELGARLNVTAQDIITAAVDVYTT
jgi:hypothetical protein